MDPLLTALEDHYDFLATTQPAPLDVILPAVIAQKPERAAPLLIAHLWDPETPMDSLVGVIDALAVLETPEVREAVAAFVARYHADSSFADDPRALIAAAQLLARPSAAGDRDEERALLAGLARASGTHMALRHALRALLTSEPSQGHDAAPATLNAERDTPGGMLAASVHDVLRAHADELRACTERGDDHGQSTRITFVARPDGGLEHLQIAARSKPVEACLLSRLYSYRFPTQRSRVVVRYVVDPLRPSQANTTSATSPTAEPPGDFWSLSERNASTREVAVTSPPWWQDQNPLFIQLDAAPAATPTAPSAVSTPRSEPEPPESEPTKQDEQDAWWLPASPSP